MDDTEPMEVAHGDGAAGHICADCGRVFSSRGTLVSHRRARHGDTGPTRRQPGPRKDRQPAAAKPAPKGRRRSLKTDLEVMYRFGGQLWSVRDPVCGGVLYAQAPVLAESIDSWAESSPRVQAAVERMLSGAGLVGVVAAHAPLVIVVFQHHGPQKHLYYPPAPPPAEDSSPPVDNQKVPADWGFGEPAYENGGPVASGYAPASADRARD